MRGAPGVLRLERVRLERLVAQPNNRRSRVQDPAEAARRAVHAHLDPCILFIPMRMSWGFHSYTHCGPRHAGWNAHATTTRTSQEPLDQPHRLESPGWLGCPGRTS